MREEFETPLFSLFLSVYDMVTALLLKPVQLYVHTYRSTATPI